MGLETETHKREQIMICCEFKIAHDWLILVLLMWTRNRCGVGWGRGALIVNDKELSDPYSDWLLKLGQTKG